MTPQDGVPPNISRPFPRLAAVVVLFAILLGRAAYAFPVFADVPDVPDVRATARTEYAVQRTIRHPRLVRGNPEVREIALTFDDGPHTGKTELLLEILRKADVHATFFVVGKEVDAHPELLRAALAGGHEIANHTYSHVRLPGLEEADAEAEMRHGASAIERAVGSPTRLFRPPGGEYDGETLQALKRLGYVMVLWTDDPGDWARPQASLLERRVLEGVGNGSIILLHDGIPETLLMLPDLIARLKARGYRFVTVSEMARRQGAHVMGGPCIVARRAHP